MFTINIMAVVTVVALFFAGLFAAKLFYRADDRVERRRLAAADLATVLAKLGLARIPGFLKLYSVGDYSGMANEIEQVAKLFLTGEAAVLAEFAQVFDRVLDVKLKDPAQRAYLAARLSQSSEPSDANKPVIAALVNTAATPVVAGLSQAFKF
jgi:hypothetical protein